MNKNINLIKNGSMPPNDRGQGSVRKEGQDYSYKTSEHYCRSGSDLEDL
jgi:hypothetical protein